MKRAMLTSVRFKKKLAELKAKGYTFVDEIKVCNKDVFFDLKDRQFFKEMGVNEEFYEYPIGEIGLYFENTEENTMCLVLLEACENSMGKISSSIGGICETDSNEEYYIDLGDPIPDVGLEGEEISTFELKSPSPMFISALVNSQLTNMDEEFAEEFAIDTVQEAKPMADMYNWKYKSVMLNNDVHEALFRFRDISLNELLSDLNKNRYELVALGLVDVRSLVDSITVCVFKNNSGYSYISFFYGVEEEEFMVKIQSRETMLKRIKVNGKYVPLFEVNVESSRDTSTLIQGFDFENFKEYNLAI